MEINLLTQLIVGGFVGAAAGYLGSFMVLKRMSLVGDALSHVALPGMAIAIAFNFSPILGALIALTIAVIGIWHLEETSAIYPEALVGLFFTASLAIGILITPQLDLLEALFGDIQNINPTEAILTILLSIMIILFTRQISKKLVLGVISKELMESLGISEKKVNLIYLLLVGCIVAIGVKFIGTLLMGALVIIPAVSAKNISRSLNNYYFLSMVLGIISTMSGIFLANSFNFSTGPIVVLSSLFFFILTYFIKQTAK